MKNKKASKNAPKGKLHQRNPHEGRYDLNQLTEVVPDLKAHLIKNVRGEDSVNFADPQAVMLLNKALLIQYYDLNFWEIPVDFLCPPVPGRADYIHHLSDLLAGKNFGQIPAVHVLDLGVGANCIYPIIGSKAYHWTFVGSDIDPRAIESAQNIIDQNARLKGQIELRLQPEPSQILKGVMNKDEKFDLVMSNPPFHSSADEALESSSRKVKNLNKGKETEIKLNFGGQSNELWYPGGERRFISALVNESKEFAKNCFWFTSLVSKASHLKALENSLDFHKAVEVRTINMSQGNKASRILAWTFLNKEEQSEWRNSHWSAKKES